METASSTRTGLSAPDGLSLRCPSIILQVDSNLDMEDDRAKTLARKLRNGDEIGLSIGGWFLEVRFIEDEKGRVERIIVDQDPCCPT